MGGGRVGLGRLECVRGRRLVTGNCVSVRQTTSVVVRGFGCAFLCRLSFYPLQEWLGVGESGSGVAASRAWLSGRFMPWTNALCQSSMSFSCVLTVGS